MNHPTIVQLLLNKEATEPQTIYLRQPRNKQWDEITWENAMQQARKVARFLQNQGLKKGDAVSIYSKNCAQWLISDFGITLAGLVSVPLFANQQPDSMQHVFNHAEVKLVIMGKLDNHKVATNNIPDEIPTLSLGYHDDMVTDFSWEDVLELEPLQKVEMPKSTDVYTIMYTSGTSGLPKGVVFTHEIIANFLEVCPRDLKQFTSLEHQHLISYLPLAHIYERAAVQLLSVCNSSDVSFVESLESFADNLREIEPTIFTAVPRIWGVFQHKISAKIPPGKLKFLLKLPLISSLIKKKIRRQLGLRRCLNCVSGAAHLPDLIFEFFQTIGINIQEGYGQTENLAYVTINPTKGMKKGYVGRARTDVQLKIGHKEELLVKSNCLMHSYFKDSEATQEAFQDGWLKTGDIADMDGQGNVKILGRLSEIFKNQKGEFVHPTPIEKKFQVGDWIEQLCLVGKGLPSNVMIVSLANEAKNQEEQLVRERLQALHKKINSKLNNYEKISHILVTKQSWTPENGFLTPTLKVKRREIEQRYQDQIEQALANNQLVHYINNT